jgi:hypothetical protein
MNQLTRAPAGRRRVLLAVAVGTAVFAAVFGALAALDATDGDPPRATPPPPPAPASRAAAAVPARIVTVAELRRIARSSARPVYWAGIRRGTRIEYTRTSDGTTYVRYLTGGALPGNESAGYVVIATYAQPDAYRRVSRTASREGFSVEPLSGGGRVVTRRDRPLNAYVVYRGRPYQIEVYAPRPGHARELALAGVIAPVA